MRLNIKLINCNYSHDLFWPRILAKSTRREDDVAGVAKLPRSTAEHKFVSFCFLDLDFGFWFLVLSSSSTINRKSERINYTKFDYDCCTKTKNVARLKRVANILAFSHLLPAPSSPPPAWAVLGFLHAKHFRSA